MASIIIPENLKFSSEHNAHLVSSHDVTNNTLTINFTSFFIDFKLADNEGASDLVGQHVDISADGSLTVVKPTKKSDNADRPKKSGSGITDKRRLCDY